MKLRNKKTGEVVEADYISVARSGFDVKDKDGNTIAKDIWTLPLCYLSVRELTSEFEDYKPAEPLIKDEKIRKAVRAWAEACGAKQIKYSIALNQYSDADMGTGFSIKFLTKPIEVYLEEGKIYTITELCGEEEE